MTSSLPQLRQEERPRERCLRSGASCLSLRELLAVLLGSGPRDLGSLGLATALVERPGAGLPPDEAERAYFLAMELSSSAFLAGMRGLGDAGQARLLAAFELGRRYALLGAPRETAPASGDRLRTEVIRRIPGRCRSEPAEWLGFVPLHRSGELGAFCLAERGTRTHVNTDPAELFARVLALRPKGLFLFHNHPSGSLAPSSSDHELTRKVDSLCRQLGLRLHGHAIITARAERWIEGTADML